LREKETNDIFLLHKMCKLWF